MQHTVTDVLEGGVKGIPDKQILMALKTRIKLWIGDSEV